MARAGSTWLFEMLRRHSEVFVPPAKDLYFFDRYYDRGMAWYLGHFQQAGDAKAVGELSHDYYFSPEAARRIHEALPEVKLILCLREPVDRLISGYRYNRTTHLGREISLAEYAADPAIRNQFDYLRHVRCYFELFGRERVLVLFYEELQADPAAFLRTVYRFIGVDDRAVPEDVAERINPAREARADAVALLAYRCGLLLRRIGLANLVGRVKAHPWVNAMLYRPLTPEARPEVPAELVVELRRDFDGLESLLGRPLPEPWRG